MTIHYGDLKGYYLYGSIGEGLVCWVNGNNLVANTGADVVFVGVVQEMGLNQVELTDCTLMNSVEVSKEPGLSITDPIQVQISSISSKHINRWISFSGKIIGISPYGDDYWYYLAGDYVCLTTEAGYNVGDNVQFIGKVISIGELWTTIIDCEPQQN